MTNCRSRRAAPKNQHNHRHILTYWLRFIGLKLLLRSSHTQFFRANNISKINQNTFFSSDLCRCLLGGWRKKATSRMWIGGFRIHCVIVVAHSFLSAEKNFRYLKKWAVGSDFQHRCLSIILRFGIACCAWVSEERWQTSLRRGDTLARPIITESLYFSPPLVARQKKEKMWFMGLCNKVAVNQIWGRRRERFHADNLSSDDLESSKSCKFSASSN